MFLFYPLFLADLEEEEEEEEAEEVEGFEAVQCGAIWPVCWQLKQTIGLGFQAPRFGVEEEEEEETAVEERFLVEDVLEETLLTSAIAFANCLCSPVNCWKKKANTKSYTNANLWFSEAISFFKNCSAIFCKFWGSFEWLNTVIALVY